MTMLYKAVPEMASRDADAIEKWLRNVAASQRLSVGMMASPPAALFTVQSTDPATGKLPAQAPCTPRCLKSFAAPAKPKVLGRDPCGSVAPSSAGWDTFCSRRRSCRTRHA